jgi:hypothetical protein
MIGAYILVTIKKPNYNSQPNKAQLLKRPAEGANFSYDTQLLPRPSAKSGPQPQDRFCREVRGLRKTHARHDSSSKLTRAQVKSPVTFAQAVYMLSALPKVQ